MTDYSGIKEKLETQLKVLNEQAEHIEDDLSEEGDDDWSENATEAEGDEVLEKMGNRALATMSQIQLALKKIKDGTYGKCAGCGTKIAMKRLEAIPYATSCVKCAEGKKTS